MKIIPSLLITVSVLFIAPSAVSQVLRSSDFNTLATTSSEDLMGVQPRTIEDWNWEAIGGEYPIIVRPPSESRYEIRVRQLNEAHQDSDDHLGDYDRPTRRFPVVDF
ncbi:hypothetical protein [Crocosphaera sp.]|uniref:hypothetical protein n=1 Tax=Crocosphaera sp. TaxID=2729996 RepID=UPI003F1F41B6|nr:hypothetical protein [Crocosphaera sp.]